MRKTAFGFTALAFLSLLAFAQEDAYYSDSFARLTYVKGYVVVQRAADLGTEEGVVNLALVEGDQLETGAGRGELSFGRKNFLRLDNMTVVELSNMPREGDDRVRIHLLKGTVYLRLNSLREEKTFELHTPDASFYALEEGLYRFDMRENAETELSVIEGSMEAAGEGGSLLIGSREKLLATGGNLGSHTNLSYGRDDFDHWNSDRDALHSQYVSKRYLSSELEDYEYELADNGRWVYERPYGYVWVPHSYVDDWRPYYYGRWLWYPTCGWSWVSYEPWGWCTSHYGRWHWRLGLGWYWIPHRSWGPAWVHWYWGHDYCGWAPLSWYNRPVVLVNNYFYDRFNGLRYPGGSRALTVVHRNQLQNRHISSVALSRTEASRLGELRMQARQPDIRPTLRGSGLQRSVPSGSATMKPTIRPSSLSRNPGGSAANPSSRLSRSSLGRSGQTVTERPPASGSRVSSGSLSKSGSVGARPATPSSRNKASVTPRSKSPSAGSVSSSPRRIRTDGSARRSTVSSSSPSAVRPYSASPRVSSSRQPSSAARGNSPRTYKPNARISRFGTNSSPSSTRNSGRVSSSGQSQLRGRAPSLSNRGSSSSLPSRSFSGSKPARSSSAPRLRSFSGSSSRSVFSAPKSSSPSRSMRSSSPSVSRSAPRSSPRVSSGSRSAPSRSSSSSSSSRSSSRSSVRKKN